MCSSESASTRCYKASSIFQIEIDIQIEIEIQIQMLQGLEHLPKVLVQAEEDSHERGVIERTVAEAAGESERT